MSFVHALAQPQVEVCYVSVSHLIKKCGYKRKIIGEYNNHPKAKIKLNGNGDKFSVSTSSVDIGQYYDRRWFSRSAGYGSVGSERKQSEILQIQQQQRIIITIIIITKTAIQQRIKQNRNALSIHASVSSRIGLFLSLTFSRSQVPSPQISTLPPFLQKDLRGKTAGSTFLKVLFIHKYSGEMASDAAFTISSGYFSSAALVLYSQSFTPGLPEPGLDLKFSGVVMFVVGIVGNMYHHVLLAKLRKEGEGGGKKEYKIPKGGLFGEVICPHYMFEILVFWGFFMISQTIYSMSLAMSTTFYLVGRSYATRRWYLSKFDDFPKHIKALIPFVF